MKSAAKATSSKVPSAKRSLASTDNSPRICGYCGAVNCEHAAGNSSICEYMSGKAEYPAKREAVEDVLVVQCTFKRTQKGRVERGIMIGEDRVIVDKNFRAVKAPVWSYTNHPFEGCIVFRL